MVKRTLAEIIEGEFLIDMAICDLRLGGYSDAEISNVMGPSVGRTRLRHQYPFKRRLREWQLGITAGFHPSRDSFDALIEADRLKRRIGGFPPSLMSPIYQAARRLRLRGDTYAVIGKTLGRSRQRIHQILNPSRKKRVPEPELEDDSIPEWKRNLMELTSEE